MRKTILFSVTFIVIRMPSYSIMLNVSKMNRSLEAKLTKKLFSCVEWPVLRLTGQFSFPNNVKLLYIPPLFHQNKSFIKYKDKAELFHNFFTNQFSLINNSSKLSSVLFKRVQNFDYFSTFTSTLIEWNKIDKNIRKSENLNIFQKSILKSIHPSQNRV